MDTTNPLYAAIVDPLVSFYRQSLEECERLNQLLTQHKNETAEQLRYLRRRVDTSESYINLIEGRVDALTNVVMSLLQHGESITRDETTYYMRDEAQRAEDSDFLWQLLLEVETESENEFEFDIPEEEIRRVEAML